MSHIINIVTMASEYLDIICSQVSIARVHQDVAFAGLTSGFCKNNEVDTLWVQQIHI